MYAALAATTPGVGQQVLDATTDFLPQLSIVGAGAVAVGAGVLIWKRGWGFFKGLSK